uniref:Ig-like domain-containing protein n=1 Tax=Anopheles farauti TaxID=69004 RepID=A0A182QLT0_9DIPT
MLEAFWVVTYGPHFETDNVTNITVQNGDTLFLSCRISLLQDKTVSWVRRKSGDTALQLLTVGKQTYSGDSRYQIEFQYPNNWRLKISQANKNDEGVYECQISTHPPKVIIYYLHVNVHFHLKANENPFSRGVIPRRVRRTYIRQMGQIKK